MRRYLDARYYSMYYIADNIVESLNKIISSNLLKIDFFFKFSYSI